VGSLFFTAAGFLTYREAVDAGPALSGGTPRRFFVFQPARTDWWATAVQLVGTPFFNVSTGNVLRLSLTAQEAKPAHLATRCPWFDLLPGCKRTCLVRGLPRLGRWRPGSWSWWITLTNLIGSVAFGVSAVAGYLNPATGQVRNADRSSLGTFIGAVCFLVGALPLLPERTEEVT
jgi:hypothetical protein